MDTFGHEFSHQKTIYLTWTTAYLPALEDDENGTNININRGTLMNKFTRNFMQIINEKHGFVQTQN